MSKPSMEDLLKGRSAADSGTGTARPATPAPAGAGASATVRYLIGGTVILVLVLIYLVYGFYTLQEGQKELYAEMQEQTEQIQQQLAELKTQAAIHADNIDDLKSDSKVIQQRVGVTQNELNQARAQVAAFREQQNQRVAEIQYALSKKAETEQLTAVKLEADQKIGAVNKDVGAVRTDVEETKKTLGDTQRQLIDVRDTLRSEIARNKGELDQLRRKGERDYIEFSATRNAIVTVHDIRLQLRKADQKKSRYDIHILVDDQRLEKKDRTANEPVQFLVGKDRVRYEIVVNTVSKNRVEGYLSVPKDKGLSAERPVGQ